MKKIKSLLCHWLPVDLIVRYCANKYRRGSLSMRIYNGESYAALLKSALEMYLSEAESQDKEYRNRVVSDALYCYFKFRVKPGEYFNFRFPEKDDETRKTYISDEERVEALLQVEGPAGKMELRDKWAFYQKTKPFFKRAVFHLSSKTDYLDYLRFVLDNKTVFCKPNTGAMGAGIHSFEIGNDDVAKQVYDQLLSECGDWVVEERIIQSEMMAEWNDSSINTIRFPSFLKNGSFMPYYPKLRVGRKGEIVDNFAQGGLIAMIDAGTGVIESNAYSKDSQEYDKHPDSGKKFINAKIPEWKELLEYVEKLHRSMPQHVYVAWDLAHTKNGWDLVEANWGQLGSTQMMLGHGIKEQFYSMIGYNE